MNESFDISTKIDAELADVLIDLDTITARMKIPYVVIGATARDIYFTLIYNIETRRATMDLDIAIRIGLWGDFDQLKEALIETGIYRQDNTQIQRLLFGTHGIVDLVPYGTIAGTDEKISWPPEFGVSMSTTGFVEVFQSAVDTLIQTDPEVFVKVATPAGLTLLKLNSWHDRPLERQRDAVDILFILTEYIRAGNEDRLFNEDSDVVEEEDFDYELAGSRLLGRDIRKIATPGSTAFLLTILEKEVKDGIASRLIYDMIGGKLASEELVERTQRKLIQLKLGLSGR